MNYPVYKPLLFGNELEYVNDCLNSTWISSKGKYISLFENSFKEFLGLENTSSVSNGTVALHLAMLALGIKEDDEVIVPTFTYVASVNAIKFVNAKPVFVDSDIKDWNIDTTKIENKITPKTKAILAVHLYGASCNMDDLVSICKKHNLFLIEDVAEGFGTKFNGKYAGSFGDVSTFSFFGNKTITTGEGGMVASKKKLIIEKVNHLKSQAVSKDLEYWHDSVGYNYRMTNICAAIGYAQIQNAEKILNLKNSVAQLYKRELKDTNLIFQKESKKSYHSYWMVSVLFKSKKIKDKIREVLKSNGIETRPLFYPNHTLPMYEEESNYPVASLLSKSGINLPSYPSLREKDINHITKIIKNNL